jgi:16S rRNA (cytosine1402-N4)-methyltransferase
MEYWHEPVLLAEVLQYLNCKSGSIVVDCTLGGAGHAEAILDAVGAKGFLIGIDLDDAAIKAAKKRLARFSQQTKFFKANFKDLDKILSSLGLAAVDGFLFDLGVSSAQLDRPERGFSYQFDAPLDMRMDTEQKLTAREIVNSYSEQDLSRIIRVYGEEKWASRIASFIVKARKRKSIETTFDLVRIIKEAIPAAARRKGGHPARRTFQAIRIEVNQELRVLEPSFRSAVRWLKSGGRIVIISYHSLEDRIAKEVLVDLATGCICPPEIAICQCGRRPVLKLLTRKVVRPSKQEVSQNPRAESARLRAAEKL